jgi:hypothetical protein
MTSLPPQPALDFYRRDDCEPCDEARIALQQVLEERVRRGDRIPRVRYRNVNESAALESDFGSRVPVLAVNGEELALKVGERQIAAFLDRVLGRRA